MVSLLYIYYVFNGKNSLILGHFIDSLVGKIPYLLQYKVSNNSEEYYLFSLYLVSACKLEQFVTIRYISFNYLTNLLYSLLELCCYLIKYFLGFLTES